MGDFNGDDGEIILKTTLWIPVGVMRLVLGLRVETEIVDGDDHCQSRFEHVKSIEYRIAVQH
jgi:hypothetical protein